MGIFKNQKDKVVGSAKEKIGELINKEELKDAGRTQAEFAKENEVKYQERITEIEDKQAEANSKNQDLTKERIAKNENKKTPIPEAEHIPKQQKIDEQRMKHYTGIEEKL